MYAHRVATLHGLRLAVVLGKLAAIVDHCGDEEHVGMYTSVDAVGLFVLGKLLPERWRWLHQRLAPPRRRHAPHRLPPILVGGWVGRWMGE
jgi:hypothetical protein